MAKKQSDITIKENFDIVIQAIQKANKNAMLVNDRSILPATLSEMTRPGDVILLMGARDPSLSDFAIKVLEKLPATESTL